MSTSTLYIDNIYNKAGTKKIIDNDNGVINLPNNTIDPDVTEEGSLYYNSSIKTIKVKTNVGWTDVFSPYDGSTESKAAPSAKYIKDLTNTTTDGLYWIKKPGTTTAYQVFCDMNTNGGGWMLVMTLIGGPLASNPLNHYSIQNGTPSVFTPRWFGGPAHTKGVQNTYSLYKDYPNMNIQKTSSFWNGSGSKIDNGVTNASTVLAHEWIDTGNNVTWNDVFDTGFPSGSNISVARTLNNGIHYYIWNGGGTTQATTSDTYNYLYDVLGYINSGYGWPNTSDQVGTAWVTSTSVMSSIRHWLNYNNGDGLSSIRCQPTCWSGTEDVYQENSWWIREQNTLNPS